jgi:hypothetical protein
LFLLRHGLARKTQDSGEKSEPGKTPQREAGSSRMARGKRASAAKNNKQSLTELFLKGDGWRKKGVNHLFNEY